MSKKQYREGKRLLAEGNRVELHADKLDRQFYARQAAATGRHEARVAKLRRKTQDLWTRGEDMIAASKGGKS